MSGIRGHRVDVALIDDVEVVADAIEPRNPVTDSLIAGIPRTLIPYRVRKMLEDDQRLLRDREGMDALLDLTWVAQGESSVSGWPFHVRQAAAYAARWIAELERANHDLRGLLVEHDKAAELASNEMTAVIARHTEQKSRATAAFFHIFDRVREYGHPVESLTELMTLTGNVYTRKALLGHLDSMRQIVDRMKAIPSALLKRVVGVTFDRVSFNGVQQQAGPVVENNQLRRRIDVLLRDIGMRDQEIFRLNQRLAAIGFKPRKGKRK